MNLKALLAVLLLTVGWVNQREPRLEASSMYDLTQSSLRMQEELDLSAEDRASFEAALDLLIGEETRKLLAAVESSEEPREVAGRMALEAKALAPVAGLTFDEVLGRAADRLQGERLATVDFAHP